MTALPLYRAGMSIVPRILHAVSIIAISSAGLQVTTRNFTAALARGIPTVDYVSF